MATKAVGRPTRKAHAEGSVIGQESASTPGDHARKWVEATCAAQGFPTKVDNASVLRAIAVLLTAGKDLIRSDFPVRPDSAGVELVATSDSGSDCNGVEQRGKNGTLARGIDGVPLAS